MVTAAATCEVNHVASFILILVTKHHKYSQSIVRVVLFCFCFFYIYKVSSENNVMLLSQRRCNMLKYYYLSLCANIVILAVIC